MIKMGTHLPILTYVLSEATKGDTIVEFGMGEYSTPFFHAFSKNKGIQSISYETNKDWMDKYKSLKSSGFRIEHLTEENLDGIIEYLVERKKPKIAFVDTGFFTKPETHRGKVVKALADTCLYIICHDTESSDYGYDFRGFKYRTDQTINGLRTTLVSNFINVSKLSFQDI